MKTQKKKEIEEYDEPEEEEAEEEEQEETEQEEKRFPVKKLVKQLPKIDSVKELKKEIEKDEPEERYVVANVPTNREPMIVDMTTKTPLSPLEVTARILNWMESHE